MSGYVADLTVSTHERATLDTMIASEIKRATEAIAYWSERGDAERAREAEEQLALLEGLRGKVSQLGRKGGPQWRKPESENS